MGLPNPDVVVIGSGAGGGACAWALAREGVRVLVLEAGPVYDPFSDYRLHRPDWEQRRFPDKLDAATDQTFAPLQKLEQRWRELRSWNHLTGRLVSGSQRQSWGYHHVRGVGGTTLHFTGEAHRLHPEAMRMNSRFGVAADWPLDYDELEPYYVQTESVVGVSGPPANPARPRSSPYPLPPHAVSYASQRLQASGHKLGLHWEPNPVAALSRAYDGRPPCNYCGNCTRGCPRTDKGSVDVTFMRKALASGACTLRAGHQVTHIEAGNDDRIGSVHYLDVDGRAGQVTARAIVLACGAVETPRMLLVSANPHAPEGPGNEDGQVGRHFMETLAWTASGLHPEPLGSHRGLPTGIICWSYNAPDAIEDVVGGCRFSPTVLEADLGGPINYAHRVVGGWGRRHKQRMRALFGRVLSVGAIGESLPNPGSYVDLDPQAKDRFGRPKARIHSFLGEAELRRLAFMAKMTRQILRAAGAENLFEEYGTYDAFNSTHVFGTCRMGLQAHASVVDRHQRSHRWRNLFIADASVFPSSGGGEAPSLTIEALAIRAAEQIVKLANRNEL